MSEKKEEQKCPYTYYVLYVPGRKDVAFCGKLLAEASRSENPRSVKDYAIYDIVRIYETKNKKYVLYEEDISSGEVNVTTYNSLRELAEQTSWKPLVAECLKKFAHELVTESID